MIVMIPPSPPKITNLSPGPVFRAVKGGPEISGVEVGAEVKALDPILMLCEHDEELLVAPLLSVKTALAVNCPVDW